MPPKHRPHCGYCFKEFFKVKDVQLHIGNTQICRDARNRARSCHQPTPQEEIADIDMNDVVQYHEEADYVPSDRWEDTEAGLNDANLNELPN